MAQPLPPAAVSASMPRYLVSRGANEGAAVQREATFTRTDQSETIRAICGSLVGAIESFKQTDLSIFASSVEKHTALYKAVTEITLSNTMVETRKTEQGPVFKIKDEALEALQKIRDDCRLAQQPAPDASGENKKKTYVISYLDADGGEASAIALCKKLGISDAPGASSAQTTMANGDRKWMVTPDIAPLDAIIASITGTVGADKKVTGSLQHKEMTIAEYNRWKSAVDAHVAHLEDANKKQAQKYANSYSQFEHFYKTVSSIIETLARSLRGYLQF